MMFPGLFCNNTVFTMEGRDIFIDKQFWIQENLR